jgi:hypothetical protein
MLVLGLRLRLTLSFVGPTTDCKCSILASWIDEVFDQRYDDFWRGCHLRQGHKQVQ